ncbi:nicotinate-nucleotide--dimethylbenzimidazole phosphoribosyltransferase [Magnetospirillum sulfuroxidans]|uniref:Nicotinate-nucleotide--dimethylbenzimidazole phosphoribosyltransferase n=1 Tax=Magnetospirillum sulfuroxidans TaxID=611300 RepID=A0ABS5IG47_9PROT|nr:nicotinate-nucleotide--dimethylbenzimidazole phosphoribosyltransferase [Magnetospirillum sulfuroxidans]MBR9972728.1 nicotinate-nucleotide--dimethylbenzimidazole phosphoribosyltransferase [Magnetospirillum sulfuroxidans]
MLWRIPLNTSISSVAHIRTVLAAMPGEDLAAVAVWSAREPQLTKPAGSLGRLEELGRWLSAWQGRHPPRLDKVVARVFAGNHGVAALGVSAFPPEVTVQMVANFQHGGAAINQLCTVFGTELDVVSLELDRPTADFTQMPAMTEAEFVAAFLAGMDAVPADTDLLCIGEMGIGNTTPAAAISCALFGGEAALWTGRGTGIDGAGLDRKTQVVAAGVARHGGQAGLDILRCLGGRELVAMAGATLAARLRRVPVLLDGYVCTAAVAALLAECPGALDHCVVAHASAEPGHRRLMEALGKTALFDLGMRLGEASGAALAVGVVRAALACHTGMATFAEAGVSGA